MCTVYLDENNFPYAKYCAAREINTYLFSNFRETGAVAVEMHREERHRNEGGRCVGHERPAIQQPKGERLKEHITLLY